MIYSHHLRIVLYTLILITLPPHISTAENLLHKNWVCTSVVKEMRRFHSVPSLSGQNTTEAINAIRAFRLNVLGQPEAKPTWHRRLWFRGQEIGSGGKKRLARHLRGIEVSQHAFSGLSIDEEGVVAGITIKGKHNISNWWRDIKQSSEEVWSMSDSRDMDAWLIRLLGTYLGYNVLQYWLDPTKPWQVIILPTLLVGFFGHLDSIPRFFWEQDYRFSAKQTTVPQTLEALERDPFQWFFFSTAYRNRATFIDKLWKSGYIDKLALRSIDNLRTQSLQWVATYTLLGITLVRPWHYGETATAAYQHLHHNTWVIWDGLFTQDPESGEPMMVLFIRLTKKRPAYPKQAPVWKPWWLLLGQPTLKPVPIPPQR